jgi:hypothetical protein
MSTFKAEYLPNPNLSKLPPAAQPACPRGVRVLLYINLGSLAQDSLTAQYM